MQGLRRLLRLYYPLWAELLFVCCSIRFPIFILSYKVDIDVFAHFLLVLPNHPLLPTRLSFYPNDCLCMYIFLHVCLFSAWELRRLRRGWGGVEWYACGETRCKMMRTHVLYSMPFTKSYIPLFSGIGAGVWGE